MANHDRIALQFRDRLQRRPHRSSLVFVGFAAETVTLSSSAPYDFSWTGSSHYLALHDLRLSDGDITLEGVRKTRLSDLTDTMTFIPKGATVSGWSAPADRDNSFTVLYFDPCQLSEEVRELYKSNDLVPSLYFKDPLLLSTMQKLRRVLEQPDQSRIHVESVGLLAAVELIQLQRPEARERPAPKGGLSRRQEVLVRSFIEDNLSSDLSLSDLAHLVDLTRFHFARAFRVSVGLPPHQYILQRRVQRAQELLLKSDLEIGTIAERVGFKTAPNLARTFVRVVAITPRDFRRSRS